MLQPLYTSVLVPQTVAGELQQADMPDAVRTWIAQPPDWCEIPAGPTFRSSPPVSRSRRTRGDHTRAVARCRPPPDRRVGKGAPKPNARTCSSPVPWASWPRPINKDCSILRRRSRGFVRRTSICRHSSTASTSGYRPEEGKRDCRPRAPADLASGEFRHWITLTISPSQRRGPDR